MQNSPAHPFKINSTCTSFDSRALCAICRAPAIGRNFDAYTCLSCKAFFRRNAYNDYLRYTCRARNVCEITMTTRRHCSACRLNKCFQQGMKKELIRSLLSIHQASNAMNRHRYHQGFIHIDHNLSSDQTILKQDDWILLTNIRNTYETFCIEPFLASHQTIPLNLTNQPYRSRLKLQRFAELKHKYLSIIGSFVKRILQNDSTREIYYEYIKKNLGPLLPINANELMRSNYLQHLPWQYDRLLFESILSEDLLERMENIVHIYRTFLPYDSLVMKLFLLILALNPCSTPLEQRNDLQIFPLGLFYVQNSYLKLAWKYIIYRFGDTDAIMFFVRFIQYFLVRQTIEADIMTMITNRDDQGRLTELLERTVKL